MAVLEDSPWLLFGISAILGLAVLAVLSLVAFRARKGDSKQSGKAVVSSSNGDSNPKKVSKKAGGSGSKASKTTKPKKSDLGPHPYLAADFKGHTESILSLDFEPSGKYLVSSSEDRSIRLWPMKTLSDKEHRHVRTNIEYDHASHVVFSPDGTAIACLLTQAHSVRVYKISKNKTTATTSVSLTEVLEFSLPSNALVVSLDIARSGKYIITCNEEAFTVWTLKGENLCSVDTRQSPNTSAVLSPCSKFIACTGFTPDVKIWEIDFSKDGTFNKVNKVMDLKGHSAAVLSLTFSSDSTRAITISRDRTCRIWNVEVRYELKEDPKLLNTIALEDIPCCVSLSPDGLVVGVAINTSITFYSVLSGDLLDSLSHIHNDTITCLKWHPFEPYIISAGGRDRYIRVWHNVPGMKEQIKDLQNKLQKTTGEAMKGRLRDQITKRREKLLALIQDAD